MSLRRSGRVASVVASLGLLVAACGGSDSQSGDDADPNTPAVEAPAADEAGDASPDGAVPALMQFSAPLIGGGDIDANELADKPTAFWFWSPT